MGLILKTAKTYKSIDLEVYLQGKCLEDSLENTNKLLIQVIDSLLSDSKINVYGGELVENVVERVEPTPVELNKMYEKVGYMRIEKPWLSEISSYILQDLLGKRTMVLEPLHQEFYLEKFVSKYPSYEACYAKFPKARIRECWWL